MENFKFAKNHENIKFSTEMPYRLVSLPQKLPYQFHSLKNYSFSRKISLKIISFHSKKPQMYNFLSKQTPVHLISLKKYRFYQISLFQQIPRI